MSYWLHPEAEIEFTDAALYYAEHASTSFDAGQHLAAKDLGQRLVVEQIAALDLAPAFGAPLAALGFDRRRRRVFLCNTAMVPGVP